MTSSSATTAYHADFPDWLSPILVKELRQGLKARLFIGVFILLQAVMIILLGLELATMANQPDTDLDDFNVFFWIVTSLALVALSPVRGLTTVSEEQKINTLDLVQLSRLSALRMVIGKWLALAVQTTLLMSTILPYLVLRYFIGQINIFNELALFASLYILSLLLTALTIALSTASILVRCLVVAGLVPGSLFLLRFLEFQSVRSRMSGRVSYSPFSDPMTYLFDSWVHFLLSVVMVGIYIFYLLEMAAAKIAPASENHSRIKRVFCHSVLLYILLLSLFGLKEWLSVYYIATFPLMVWSMVDALSEPTNHLPCIYEPFFKRGFIGRCMAKLYQPGWASGIIYCASTIALLQACALVFRDQIEPWEDLIYYRLIFFFGMVTPVFFLVAFRPKQNRMWFYVLCFLLHGILFLVASVRENFFAADARMPGWLAAFPSSLFFGEFIQAVGTNAILSIRTPFYVCAGIYTGLFAYFIIREFRSINRLVSANLGEGALDLPPANPVPATLRLPDLE